MLQQLVKYPVQVFSPAVMTHPIVALHITTDSQNHFYDVTLSPTVTVYPVGETLHSYVVVFSNAGVRHHHRHTYTTTRNHVAFLIKP